MTVAATAATEGESNVNDSGFVCVSRNKSATATIAAVVTWYPQRLKRTTNARRRGGCCALAVQKQRRGIEKEGMKG